MVRAETFANRMVYVGVGSVTRVVGTVMADAAGEVANSAGIQNSNSGESTETLAALRVLDH